ncbi:energy-coupling factor transporter ATPase [Mycoplasma sp. 6243]|uniref:energy-coupling factor transporter ATPase n=1 Tax=Mycoplasma sp. 6243 TaxID=3440865 RepID=UPI003EB6EDCE
MQVKTNKITHIFNKRTPWEFTALTDVYLDVADGEYLGIIGSTGSGKTTLIEHLNGLLKPSFGTVEWTFSTDIYNKKLKNYHTESFHIINDSQKRRKIKNLKEIRKKIGIVFQFAEYQLFKNTIKDDIAFGPIAYGVPKEEAYQRARKCLEMLGLGSEYLSRSPFELSGGQKRRVAIAGILAMNPDFMVFDEPTAGLDPVGVVEILDILTNLNQSGKTIINVTHDLDHVLERASKVVVLKDGKLVRQGQPYEVLNDILFLKENNLQPPKLLEFVFKLRQNGLDVPKVKSLKELADFINLSREDK